MRYPTDDEFTKYRAYMTRFDGTARLSVTMLTCIENLSIINEWIVYIEIAPWESGNMMKMNGKIRWKEDVYPLTFKYANGFFEVFDELMYISEGNGFYHVWLTENALQFKKTPVDLLGVMEQTNLYFRKRTYDFNSNEIHLDYHMIMYYVFGNNYL